MCYIHLNSNAIRNVLRLPEQEHHSNVFHSPNRNTTSDELHSSEQEHC